MEHLNRKLQQLLLEKIALDNSLMTSLPKSILQEAIQGKLVPQIVEEGTAKELLDQIKEEKEKLVKQGKLKKSALSCERTDMFAVLPPYFVFPSRKKPQRVNENLLHLCNGRTRRSLVSVQTFGAKLQGHLR